MRKEDVLIWSVKEKEDLWKASFYKFIKGIGAVRHFFLKLIFLTDFYLSYQILFTA